jgi:signal transduction histidine kinase
MEKGVFDKIFLPFYTTKTNGTGLGMAVCKKLAAAMNGNLEATTNSGRGTEFMLEIKLQTA